MMTRSFSPDDMPELADSVRALLDTDPIPITAALQRKALRIESAHKISWWDSLIVAAALEAQCTILLSEDLQHGMKFESVKVKNPFR